MQPAASDTASMINALDNPSWRKLLLGQLDEEVEAFHRNTAMFQAFQESEKAGKIDSSLRPSGNDCVRLIEIGMRGQFPSREPWQPVGTDILGWFWTLSHPCFPEMVQAHFAAASDPSRAYGLTLLATQSTPEAAASIVTLLCEYPLPDRLPPRFFWEMNKRHAAIGSQLFPKMLVDAGSHLADVMNFLNACLEGSALTPEALAPVSDWVASESIRLLDAIEPLQPSVGKQWRCDEPYSSMRSRLGVFLDLLGIIPGATMAPCVRAVQLKDPLCAFFAIVSMLKKNLPPPHEAIQLVADSFQTRVSLYKQLGHLNRGDLFPAHLLTFESFAAASMAEWLLYPSELGYEPTRLDLMAKVSGVGEDKELVMCLWKVGAEDRSDFAAASGPYDANAPIGPLCGDNTFSNFTEWDSRTPDEHLGEIVETLDQWRVEWCGR
jgi:hypothetical protein